METKYDSRLPKSLINFMTGSRSFDLNRPSVTQLLHPPQATILQSMYPDYGEDIQDRVRMSLGTAFHNAVQGNEERFEREHPSGLFTITGEPDDYEYVNAIGERERNVVLDYKTTSVYKIKRVMQEAQAFEIIDNLDESVLNKFSDALDWILQLSMYAFLLAGDQMNYYSGRIICINFDAGNKRIMKSLKPPVPNNIQIIDLPLVAYDELMKWTDRQWTRINEAKKFYDDPSQEINVDLVKCKSSEVWGGNRCGEYCPFIEKCTGVLND